MNTDPNMIEAITSSITETYLQIQDHCRWQQYDQAQQLLDQLTDQVDDLRTVLSGYDSDDFDTGLFG